MKPRQTHSKKALVSQGAHICVSHQHANSVDLGMVNHMESVLKANGYKQTGTRRSIIAELVKCNHPVSAETIFTKIKKGQLKVDLATVYRTLTLLADLHLAHKVYLQGRTELFEVAGAHHHHIVCTSCGKIEGIDICTIDQVKSGILKDTSFSQVTGHRFEVFGVCNACK